MNRILASLAAAAGLSQAQPRIPHGKHWHGKSKNQEVSKRHTTFLERRQSPEQVLIGSMTNWQRHQWAKKKWDKTRIREFSEMRRP